MTLHVKRLAAIGIGVLLTAATLAAQPAKRPDFSGEWRWTSRAPAPRQEVRWIEKDGTMVVETTRVITGASIQTSNGDKPVVSRQYFKKRR